ncbi:hypothetical protein GUITHDRAFT_154452 [Guillardia theta CCMP2712]|uniref:CWH43-like N-terminal domain-containing protein n=2 Tax=Guillardia theta TaxID=55529 RepID=L1IU26_GUITC|nr:hypothetical protein GUITHDRAFT_154452 [Guillardia theta CCMP2712]EKX39320.1 hypothetical protein GUITHDRAFT_154452 [Guillardia theta CCMP2712]|mmetsp:Transcript_4411/g.16082  ORF Transcript_4411/g.16082 Transcript_4411/m.16082 type:complete len:277 (+) Transcript_4411:324-1154(+)|eukprot:XP_005826300.1 hypothetical protein GUITHDRAFT_154452 [Guillardia theta CCMP2712]
MSSVSNGLMCHFEEQPLTRTRGQLEAKHVPLLAAVLGVSSILVPVLSHIAQGKQPPYPTISMTAYMPGSFEYFVFASGLCTTASLLILTAIIVRWRLGVSGYLAFISHTAANIAALGLAVTSVVPLQPNIMDVLALPRAERKMTTQSNIHSWAANIFFLSSLVHAVSMTVMLLQYKSRKDPVVSDTSMRVKALTTFLSFFFIASPLLLFMYPRIIKGSRVTVVALNQYGAIMCLLSFYATYYVDLKGYQVCLKPSSSAAAASKASGHKEQNEDKED